MDLVIFGTGGHGRECHRVVADCIADGADWSLRGWLDDDPSRTGTELHGHEVLGGTDWLAEHPGMGVVVAVGNPRARRAIVRRLDRHAVRYPRVVHPTAWIGGGVELGDGVILFPGAQASTEIVLGNHTHLNQGASVSHDGRLGAFVSVAPGARVAGTCTVGDGVDLFTGCALVPSSRVGDGAVVGAGAVVTSPIPEDGIAWGVPARVHRSHDRPWNG